jgi:Domain of unknown function (DUF1839)
MCWTSPDKKTHRVAALDAASYRRHPIHGENRIWAETNCYTDLVVEMLHGLGHEPLAVMPYTLAIDFEGDQWTFFKPPHAEVEALYGVDIQELALWRPLVEHVRDQVAAGRIVLVELDSFFLPDTSGTAYKLAHVKTAVGVNEIDVESRHLGYFHNNGYFELGGDDFREVFQLDGLPHDRVLPPFCEIAKIRDGGAIPKGAALVEASLALLERHLRRAPAANPFARFRAQFERDLDGLMKADIDAFHKYSFATLRQYGACFELGETYLGWLGDHGVDGLGDARAALAGIAQTAKTFQFQLARAMSRRKPLDLAPIDAMGASWDRAMSQLRARRG